MNERSDKRGDAAPAAGAGNGGRGWEIPAELGVRVTRDTAIYVIGATITLLLALVNVAVITRFLDPAEFGELALLLTLAALLTVLYNLGTLQGIFMWVFGASGEEEVDEEAAESATGSKRRALGTGLVTTLVIAAMGTAAVAAIAPWMAELVLGEGSEADLILLAAASGAGGAVWRLVSNILRMERRPRAYIVLNTVRPVLVLGTAIPLVATGGGVEGAILGTALGSWLSVVVGLAVTWRNFELALDRTDVAMILRRGATFVPVIICFWVAQNIDLFALSKFAPDTEVGLYRVAGRFGAFLSYFSSALFMAWTPLARTPTFAAAQEARGRELLGGTFLTYFVLGGALLVLALTVGADLLVRIAPASYADAAPLIPLIAAGFLAHGLLVALYRVSKFKRKRAIYTGCAVLSAAVFLAAALLLIPWLGAYGAALSVIVGFLTGAGALAYASQHGRTPLRIEYGRIAAGIAIAGGCLLLARLLGEIAGPWRPVVEVAALVAYPVLLAASGVVPREEMRGIWAVLRRGITRRRPDRDLAATLATRPSDEVALLRRGAAARWQLGRMSAIPDFDPNTTPARLVRIVRALGGAEGSSEQDQQIGEYLICDLPIADRDALARLLWNQGAEPADIHRLERVLEELSRLPADAWPGPAPGADPAAAERTRS